MSYSLAMCLTALPNLRRSIRIGTMKASLAQGQSWLGPMASPSDLQEIP